MSRRALAAAVALAVAGGARADGGAGSPTLKVALEPLRVAGVSVALAQAVEERVCAILVEVARADVVCPSDVAAATALARNAVVFGECQSDECVRRVEALRSADQRVTGALERGEKGIVLSLQLTRADGPGPRAVEKLPDDLDAIAARLSVVVGKLFPAAGELTR